MNSGAEHPVGGRIFFFHGQWTVLFFVLDGQGKPARASAEGGSYRVDGDQLTFTHRYHFSSGQELDGLPASPLKMEIQDEAPTSEPCRLRLEGHRLTVFFPSGNSMVFQRLYRD